MNKPQDLVKCFIRIRLFLKLENARVLYEQKVLGPQYNDELDTDFTY